MNRREFFRLIGLAPIAAPMVGLGSLFTPRQFPCKIDWDRLDRDIEYLRGGPVVTELVVDAAGVTRGAQQYERAMDSAQRAMQNALHGLRGRVVSLGNAINYSMAAEPRTRLIERI